MEKRNNGFWLQAGFIVFCVEGLLAWPLSRWVMTMSPQREISPYLLVVVPTGIAFGALNKSPRMSDVFSASVGFWFGSIVAIAVTAHGRDRLLLPFAAFVWSVFTAVMIPCSMSAGNILSLGFRGKGP